jgi:ATP-dependent RNA helicase RhlE
MHSRNSRSFSARGPRRSFSRPGGRPQFNRADRADRTDGRFNSGRRGNRAKRTGRNTIGARLDYSKFINKAVITEETEHFTPEHTFADFAIESELKLAVLAKGYELPTPIQDRAIPQILKGHDVVGIANTGTGKTAAFLIPLINKVRLNPREQVLIMAPTRELAIQIDTELKGFVSGLRTGEKIFSVCCVGGVNIGPQIRELRYHNNFIIGTPGRLKDLIQRNFIKLSAFKTVVLDEADRMLDMGFIADMRFIMNGMSKDRHTLFFSATITNEIEHIIKDFLREPVRISVKTRDTSKNVDQDVIRVTPGTSKMELLHDLLKKAEFSKVLIFGRTKRGVERLSKTLIERGFKADSIHGDKVHGKRQQALKKFKDSHVQVLVATDVAARGLDIADVSHVINFDIPETYEDYIHRIGRTGRGNKKGKALTFIE